MTKFYLPDSATILFPTLDDIHWLHENVALLEGGRSGLLSEGGLLSALARPQHVLCYSEDDPDLLDLAGYLWHGISEAHAYVDANKRTAALTMIAFLAQNGIKYVAQEDEIGKLVTMWYARDRFRQPILVDYLRARCCWAV